jgi:predicted HicB family RNase H-like nuclease
VTRRPPQTDRTSVRIPCSKAERDAWVAAARRAELTLNGWIRETLRKAMEGGER